MYLVAGLGNPGRGYERTRHNVGFLVADELARRFGVSAWKTEFKSYKAEAYFNNEKIVLLKPLTYMNLSGEALREVVKYYKINIENVIVVHDELDLRFGRVKVKSGGGSAGNKGVQSIIHLLGNGDFQRIRVGIGKPQGGKEVVSHVLSKFAPDEKEELEEIIIKAADAVIEIFTSGIISALNKFNPKKQTNDDS